MKSFIFVCILSLVFTAHAGNTNQKNTTTNKPAIVKTTVVSKNKKVTAPSKPTTRAIPKSNWSKIKDMFM